jgi:7-carboxy-7-deazaguanine synthase
MTFPIVEIFGPTIQGEGVLVGMPSIFVRFGGCDFRCRWCDSMFAVQKKYETQWQNLSENEVVEQVNKLSGSSLPLVNLTGGNPALFELTSLISNLKTQGYKVNVETQGSKKQSWFKDCDYVTLSPKPPSAGNYKHQLEECIGAAGDASIVLKIVIADRKDFNFALELSRKFKGTDLVLQPVNDSSQEQPDCRPLFLEIQEWLVEEDEVNIRLIPQLHVWAWGNKQGV